MNEMTKEELISITIDKYMDLQRIKKANGETRNNELDYQLKEITAKLGNKIQLVGDDLFSWSICRRSHNLVIELLKDITSDHIIQKAESRFHPETLSAFSLS